MNEFDVLHETMQRNFTEIFSKLDKLEERQVENKKDIGYIKDEIDEKLDKRINNTIDFKIVKEKYKGLVGLIGGIFGGVGFILTVIKFFMG